MVKWKVTLELPEIRSDAIDLIDLYGKEIDTLLKVGDLALMSERYHQRAELVRQYFERYGQTLSTADLAFFKTVQEQDRNMIAAIEAKKGDITSLIKARKEQKERIKAYSHIAKQK